MKINLMFRGYLSGALKFEERKSVDASALDDLLPALARQHAAALSSGNFLLEIEFLDESDVSKRFFRMGSDPSMMREPIAVDPGRPGDALGKWKGR